MNSMTPSSTPAQIRARRKHYENNKEKVCAHVRAKYQENADEIKRKRRERYARQKANGTLPPSTQKKKQFSKK